jgi:anion-transporting  ArsA/GET3 family ATPase
VTGEPATIADLIRDRRVIICCGAGGVGKTTVSASLALSGARAGLRVAAITVDPSRRLAEALGVARNLPEPTELDRGRLQAVGVEPPGSLAAWMLDPKLVCDRVVNTVAGGEGARRELLGNRLYQNVSALVAGMHEYAAIEALHGFIRDDRYDLVVLDTPPSRDALRFLEAPARANAFLDPRILSYFLPSRQTTLHRVGSRLITMVLDLALGRAEREELQQFLSLFQNVLDHLSRNQDSMRRFLRSPQVSFLLVTSPTQAALEEAGHFELRAIQLGLPLGGFVLNQSLSDVPVDIGALARAAPPTQADADAARLGALDKLATLAAQEEEIGRGHLALAAQIKARIGPHRPLWLLPRLTRQHSDLQALSTLADRLSGSSSRSVPDDDARAVRAEQAAGELGHPASLGSTR